MPSPFHAILAYLTPIPLFILAANPATAIHPDFAAQSHNHAAPPPLFTPSITPSIAPRPTDSPDNPLQRHVSFTLADGSRITGTLTEWDKNTFTGSFGTYRWTELHHRDSFHLLQRLIDRDVPDDWLLIGRAMLLIGLDQPDAAKWAERAFRHARRVAGKNELDAIETRIREIRDEIEAEHRARKQREHDLDPTTLRTRPYEADPWPPTAWPELTPAQQRNAVNTKKADARQALSAINLEFEPIETANVLIYTDLERSHAVQNAIELDSIFRELAAILRTNPRDYPFWGKAVLIILSDRDQFDQLQSDAFGYQPDTPAAPAGDLGTVPGIVHPIGPKVFITIHHPGRGARYEFQLELTRLLVRAAMHRHISPKRLPPWANDGLGMVIADRLYYDDSSVVQQHRRRALEFLRNRDQHEALLRLIELDYADDHWPALEHRISGLGMLFIELMQREKPREFTEWIRAIKDGAPWREALKQTYGVPLPRLLDTTVRYYRVND